MATKTTKKPAKKPAPKKPAKSSPPASLSRSARQKKEEIRWEATADLDSLRRADEVRSDPERMKKARAESEKQRRALQKATK